MNRHKKPAIFGDGTNTTREAIDMNFPIIQQNQDLVQAVSARDLHEFLNSGERFSRWFDRQLQFGFELDSDYIERTFMHATTNKEMQDYFISINMAKEVSMIQRSDEGRQVRKYFIECERKAMQSSTAPTLPDFTNPALAARAWADEVEAKMVAQEQLAIAAPKTAMYDAIIESDHLLAISDVAKHLGLSPQSLNSWLIDQGVYDKRRLPQKIFKTAFIDSGFGEMKLTDGGHTQPKITQLGQSWIVHNFNKWS